MNQQKVAIVCGSTQGIGKAIALKAARDGANIVIAAKTANPHPKLLGTIYTAAEEGVYRDPFCLTKYLFYDI